MRRMGVVSCMIVICLMLAGCFEVKNTDGLRAAYEKIELAYPLVVEIDAKQNLQAKDKQVLMDSYNEAKASVNSFLKDVKTKSVTVVNVQKRLLRKIRQAKRLINLSAMLKDQGIKKKAIPPAVVFAIVEPIVEKIWS